MATNRPNHGRTVLADSGKLIATMNQRGITVEQLAQRAGCSVGTVNNLLVGKAVYRNTLAAIAEALDVSLAVLLSQTKGQASAGTVHEYLISEVLTDWIVASNGLRFQICRLRHLELDRQARGKRFDLRDLSTDEEQRCKTWIKRHPNVCSAIGNHPNIARNITAFHDPIESFYWVIDEWIEGETLARTLRSGKLSRSHAKSLIADIAHGLAALHGQEIVCRELSPSSILIHQPEGRAILTEFELAKLIDRGPTVSTDDWPADPYRAGEADSDDVDTRADIYSWGRIAIHVLARELPPPGQERAFCESLSLPEPLTELIASATAFLRSDRPNSVAEVIRRLGLVDYER